MKTVENVIYDLIQAAGLDGPWTDFRGNTQPPVVIQLDEFDEAERNVSPESRILLIRTVSGGGGDRQALEPQVALSCFGRTEQRDRSFAKHYLLLVQEALLGEFYRDQCLIGLSAIGSINGPFILDSDRRAYEINFSASVETGIYAT